MSPGLVVEALRRNVRHRGRACFIWKFLRMQLYGVTHFGRTHVLVVVGFRDIYKHIMHGYCLYIWQISIMSWAHSAVYMASGISCAVSYGEPVFGQPGFPLLSANIINMCTSRNLMCDALLVSTVAHITSSTFVERPVRCVIVVARGPGQATGLPRTRQPRHVLMTASFLILDSTAGTAGLWMKH